MATAFRALVMLTVLVGLPAAWVYYGPLPSGGQRVLDQLVTAALEGVGWKTPLDDVRKLREAEAAPRFVAGDAESHELQESALDDRTTGLQASLEPQLDPLLAHLRRLGVTEYVLEPWGAERGLFRFRCEMPFVGSELATEQFEAIAADPRKSVEQVVSEVASWHGADKSGRR
jgi:hypothetical protein